MYDELVKALRETDFGDTCVLCEHENMCKCNDCIIIQAADAIEELQKRVPKRPHGRLIDADALMAEFEKAENAMERHGREYSCSFLSSSQELSTEWYCVEDMLDNAPTIIEAEEEI